MLCCLVVWFAASYCLVLVVSRCPALPPPPFLLLPLLLGLLLLSGPLLWPVAVLCPGVPCCVVLLCRLSSIVLLSASFLAVRCHVASFARAGAVCCCLFGERRCMVCGTVLKMTKTNELYVNVGVWFTGRAGFVPWGRLKTK